VAEAETSARARPPTTELFLIISMHMMKGALKMEEQKMQDLKMQDQMSPHENAKPENEGPNDGA